MQYRRLGTTGIDVSCIAFGAGPVPALLTADIPTAHRRTVVAHALRLGINWFDTAATYGGGASEENLGASLADLGATGDVHLATKVRLLPAHLVDVRAHVRSSVEQSLKRLKTDHLTLLQLHNSVTQSRGDLATSVTVEDVLGPNGILEAMRELKNSGVVRHLGLTGLGHPEALRALIRTGNFQTIQIPFNVLNPTAGYPPPDDFAEMNFGNLLADCAQQRMGAFAIRVYAGGALVGQAPSAHTQTTKFFPLDLYERDRQRSQHLGERLPSGVTLPEAAVRFVLGHAAVSSAIVGFANSEQIDAAVQSAGKGPLPVELTAQILSVMNEIDPGVPKDES